MMDFISKAALFQGCSKEDISAIAKHLDFRTNRYRKGEVILSAGSIVTDIGLVLSGSVRIEHTDLWGNKSILGITPAGGVFAESYACIPNEPMLVDAAANEDCKILFVSVPKLFAPCPASRCQSRLIQNLLAISAEKICCFPNAAFIPPPKPYGGGCFLIFHRKLWHRKAAKSPFPLTASS